MSPTAPSILKEILAWSTSMPVLGVFEGLEIRANHVYVIEPDTNIFVSGNVFKVTTPRTMNKWRHHQVDCFLESLSKDATTRAIGVILSGGDGDGSEGVKWIKAGGGITFAQDISAKEPSMPASAWESGCVDFIMPPEMISQKLARMALDYLPGSGGL